MQWMKETLGRVWVLMWASIQGAWLFLLYCFVGYIMVGSLGSLQLRDALQDTTYDEVISVKKDFETKAEYISNRNRRGVDALYEEVNKIEDELFVLLDELMAEAEEKKIIKNIDDYESYDSISSFCAEDVTDDSLCKKYSDYTLLVEKADSKYFNIENESAKAESGREVLDALEEITKLRNKTPYTELFTTVQFMDDFGFADFLSQPRELLVLQLTMVMGTLGSLVTMTWLFIRRDINLGIRRTLFLPLVGSVSAFIIFVFFKAGQLTISSGSGTSSLSPFFLSFVGIISGLLSERAYARMESVGTKFFTVDDDHLRWGVRLREALEESGVSISDLARYLGVEEGTAKNLVDETAPATQSQQALIAASLRKEVRELFTDEAPRSIVNEEPVPIKAVVQVPDLVGLLRSDLDRIIDVHGLILGNITELPSDAIPCGQVIGQQPLANELVERGTIVSVTISTGEISE